MRCRPSTCRSIGVGRALQVLKNYISSATDIGCITTCWANRINSLSTPRQTHIGYIATCGLTNLKWLGVDDNDYLRLFTFGSVACKHKDCLAFQSRFPNRNWRSENEGPWLWAFLPDVRLDSGVDLLAEATGNSVTEVGVSTHGATLGQPVGDDEWTSHKSSRLQDGIILVIC